MQLLFSFKRRSEGFQLATAGKPKPEGRSWINIKMHSKTKMESSVLPTCGESTVCFSKSHKSAINEFLTKMP